MKGFLAFVVCLVATDGYVPNYDEYEAEWLAWKSFHNKKYETQREEDARHDIWWDNVKKIQTHNAGGHKYTLTMNQFGDLTVNDFRFFTLGPRSHFPDETKREGMAFTPPSRMTLPANVDWRTKGCVTPVKNQGFQGQSWSFSVTGSVEGQHCKKTGKLVALSEQNLVDCSGCKDYAQHEAVADCGFKYIMRNGGIDTEAGYPSPCNKSCCFLKDEVGATVTDIAAIGSCARVLFIRSPSLPSHMINFGGKEGRARDFTSYVDIQQGNESDLQYAVATIGPISVAINAGLSSFQFYQSGVYDDSACSSTELNHAVLAVGYGTYEGKDYWLIKNSWGTGWGMKGYIMMSRNKDNQCGIASNASYPLV